MNSKLPLAGIRVLDLTRLLPGAFCTLLLADLGADVIKVEEPESGDYMRWTPPLVDGQSALFNALNRSKRSVALNLKAGPGRDVLLALAEKAHVLVEGNRPGVADRLMLGWELHARNPRLVVLDHGLRARWAVSASRAGHDLNYMAIAGGSASTIARRSAASPVGAGGRHRRGGGLQPAVAIPAALVEVQRGGEGLARHPMTDGVTRWLGDGFAARAGGETVARGDQRLAGVATRASRLRVPGRPPLQRGGAES